MWQVKGILDVAPCGPERIPFRAAVALFAMGAMAFFQDTFLLFAMAPMAFFQAQPLKMRIVATQGWPPKPAMWTSPVFQAEFGHTLKLIYPHPLPPSYPILMIF